MQARNKPAGTYTYVITRTDDPNWAESTGESYSTPEASRVCAENLVRLI